MPQTEILLTVGILIAAAIVLLELVTVFSVQSKQIQRSLVADFANELESKVDKAAAATEDVNFTYFPEIKKYTVKINNSLVSIKDNLSGGETSFFKLSPEIVNNTFEDGGTIYIIKKEKRIFIFADYQAKEFSS